MSGTGMIAIKSLFAKNILKSLKLPIHVKLMQPKMLHIYCSYLWLYAKIQFVATSVYWPLVNKYLFKICKLFCISRENSPVQALEGRHIICV